MKIRKQFIIIFVVLSVIALNIYFISPALAQEQVVRAVLFYSPSCPHCHKVISEDLPTVVEKYQQQLQILGVNTASEGGQALFQAAIQQFNIPPEQQGVPMMVVGDVVLVGSVDIPERFPGLIETYLSQGGIDWPAIPGLAEAMAAEENQTTSTTEGTSSAPDTQESKQPATDVQAAETPQPSGTQTTPPLTPTPTPSGSGLLLSDDPPPGLWERVTQDPAGNTLAIVVLVGMLVSVVWAVRFFRPENHSNGGLRWLWMIPILCFIGLVVAGYLSYIETTQSTAVCGPIGDCNTVQQSPYARLFGVLPIGTLGLAGYIAILVAWVFSRFYNGQLAHLASLGLLGLTSIGTLFSIYLTFLEPFVIGATCAWCLTSAVIMTALMWLSIFPAKIAIASLNHG